MKYRTKILIAADQCKGCGRCVINCPRHVFEMGKILNARGVTAVEVVREGDCIGCGFCYYSCPEPGAVTLIREEI